MTKEQFRELVEYVTQKGSRYLFDVMAYRILANEVARFDPKLSALMLQIVAAQTEVHLYLKERAEER